MRCLFISVAVFGAVFCGGAVSAASSLPYGITPAARVLHLAFRQISGGTVSDCGTVIAGGDEALIPLSATRSGKCTSVIVINDRTHMRITVPDAARQTVLAFGPPWVLFQTPDRRDLLYNLNTGQRT